MFETTAGAVPMSPRQQRERLVSELQEQGFTDTAAENLVGPAMSLQDQKSKQAQTAGDQLKAVSEGWATSETYQSHPQGMKGVSGGVRAMTAAEIKIATLKKEARYKEQCAKELEELAVKQMRGAAFLIEHPEFVEFLQLQREGII